MRVWKALSDSGWPRLNGKELSVIKASVTGREKGRGSERGEVKGSTHTAFHHQRSQKATVPKQHMVMWINEPITQLEAFAILYP